MRDGAASPQVQILALLCKLGLREVTVARFRLASFVVGRFFLNPATDYVEHTTLNGVTAGKKDWTSRRLTATVKRSDPTRA